MDLHTDLNSASWQKTQPTLTRKRQGADSATMHNLITAQPLKYRHTSRNTPADTQCRRRCQTKPANLRPDDLRLMEGGEIGW